MPEFQLIREREVATNPQASEQALTCLWSVRHAPHPQQAALNENSPSAGLFNASVSLDAQHSY